MTLTATERQNLEKLLQPAEVTKIISELYPELKPSTHRVMSHNWRKGKMNDRRIQAEVIARAKYQMKLNAELKKILQ